jgi:repressor LexA
MSTRPTGLSVLGTIAAGEPLEQFDVGETELLELDELASAITSVPAGTGREMYALRVRGTSMIEDGILDGDYILITPGSTYVNGAIAVAVWNTPNGGRGAATVKRVFIRPDSVQLQPANAEFAARIVPAEEWDREWSVQGTVVAVYRRCVPRRIAAQ